MITVDIGNTPSYIVFMSDYVKLVTRDGKTPPHKFTSTQLDDMGRGFMAVEQAKADANVAIAWELVAEAQAEFSWERDRWISRTGGVPPDENKGLWAQTYRLLNRYLNELRWEAVSWEEWAPLWLAKRSKDWDLQRVWLEKRSKDWDIRAAK